MSFQSTLPARGATKNLIERNESIYISIHAPRTGSDNNAVTGNIIREHFNPRSPHGERHTGAPRRRPCGSHFNPRSPHGERPPRGTNEAAEWHFNPRSPHGERQRGVRHLHRRGIISIHAPRTGSDASLRRNSPAPISISIHAPRTGSDDIVFQLMKKKHISIHAPRTGSDSIGKHYHKLNTISIHAPRTGSDTSRTCDILALKNFNPRSPHGERHPRLGFAKSTSQISIHAPRTGSDRNTSHTISTQEHFNPRSPHGERPRPAA